MKKLLVILLLLFPVHGAWGDKNNLVLPGEEQLLCNYKQTIDPIIDGVKQPREIDENSTLYVINFKKREIHSLHKPFMADDTDGSIKYEKRIKNNTMIFNDKKIILVENRNVFDGLMQDKSEIIIDLKKGTIKGKKWVKSLMFDSDREANSTLEGKCKKI